jgi:hypothetical protein
MPINGVPLPGQANVRSPTMRAILAAIALAACLPASVTLAASRQVQCKLVVEGKTYINGPCRFEALGTDGSFTIGGKNYFAYVVIDEGTATASWNADPKSTHAHADLGAVTRNGACWENATAQICARGLPGKR